MSGSVRRTADGWIADVTIGGKRRTAKARTKNEALARKRELLEQLAARPSANRSSGVGITLHEARQLSLRIRWKDTAYERTAAIYSQSAVEFFGPSTQLGSIGAPEIDRLRQHLLGKGNQPRTVNMKVSAIRAMFADAALHGRIEQIPPLPKQLKVCNTKDRVISDEELGHFCAFFRSVSEPAMADLLVFMCETCCRWGEAERLKGEDVDLGQSRITLWKTKSGNPRTVPLTRRALDAIAPHLPTVKRHRVWPYDYWRGKDLFNRGKAFQGLQDDEQLTLHCTRHTCATKLATRGVPLHQLMTFGGWTSLASVQRYLHLQTDALAGCVAALEA